MKFSDSPAARPWLAALVIATGLTLIYGGRVAGQDAAPDQMKSAIQKLLQHQTDAWNHGDLEGFMETYWRSPKLTFSGGGQTTRGWQATLDRYRSRYSDREKMGQLRFDDFELHPLGDSAALVLGTWHLKNNQGSPHGNFSLVLQQMDGRWLIVHDHSSTFEPDDDQRP